MDEQFSVGRCRMYSRILIDVVWLQRLEAPKEELDDRNPIKVLLKILIRTVPPRGGAKHLTFATQVLHARLMN